MYTMLNEEIDTREELHRILVGLRDIQSHTDLIGEDASVEDSRGVTASKVDRRAGEGVRKSKRGRPRLFVADICAKCSDCELTPPRPTFHMEHAG